MPELDCILVPISGGGMTSGICIAAKSIKPEIKIIAVEPSGKELGASLQAGRRLWEGEPKFLGREISYDNVCVTRFCLVVRLA